MVVMDNGAGLTAVQVLSAQELAHVASLTDQAMSGTGSLLDMVAEGYVLGLVHGMLSEAERFFFDNAGLSYLTTEHPLMGFARHAKELAAAERWALDAGMAFHWEIDPDTDSSEFTEGEPVYSLWQCIGYTAGGAPHQSLGGIDMGRDGTPWDAPYRRVVEAELAYQEQLGE